MLNDLQLRTLAIRLLSEGSISELVWLELKEGLEVSGFNADIIERVRCVPRFANRSLFFSNEQPIEFRYYLMEGWNR